MRGLTGAGDWYNESYYGISPQANLQGAPSGPYRVLRGGAWYYSRRIVRCAYLSGDYPHDRNLNLVGFRVVTEFGFR